MFKLKSLTILLVTPQANKLRQVVRAKTSNFIRKANRAGRWCISVPKKCLAWVWMLGTFIKQRGSAKEAKLEKVTCLKCFLVPARFGRGCVNFFSAAIHW